MIKGIVPTLAEGGKIKIGGLGEERQKRGGGTYRLPEKYDHFVITSTQRDPSGDLIVDTDLMSRLPHDDDGQVREIPIVLHDDDIDRVFPTSYALYTGRRLFCHGDGETASRYELGQDGKRTAAPPQEIKCTCDYLTAPASNQMACKPHGTLHCSIRIPGRAVAGAVYKWRTTSLISIQRMIGSLQQIRDICGTLTGIPLNLRLEAVKVTPQGAPDSTVYVCHVELRAADILDVQRQAIESAKMRERVRASIGYQALLSPPAIGETEDEEAEVQQEFHPDADLEVDPKTGEVLREGRTPEIPEPQRAENGNGGSGNGHSGSGVITAPQLRRMLAISRGSRHGEDDVRAWLQREYGVAELGHVRTADYDRICDRLKLSHPLNQGELGA